MATFTVAIPAYNSAATLTAAAESVLSQSRADFELIIVDDGSTDETLAVARSFERDPRVTIVHQVNQGLPGARNTAIARGTAPFVSFLDADDLWMPEYLDDMKASLDANPDAGFAFTDAWVLDEGTRRIRRDTATTARLKPPDPLPTDPRELLRVLVRQNFIIFPGATVRRSVLEEVGAFNPRLRAAEDYELWLRIVAHGHAAVRAPRLLAIKREGFDSMSRERLRMYTALREVWRLVAEEHPAPDDVRATARARIAWAERQIAAVEGRDKLRQAIGLLRRPLGVIRRRLLDHRYWYSDPPPEIARAFPDLDRI
jgi:glycosyltransferase involved in cell wall biosynthesis